MVSQDPSVFLLKGGPGTDLWWALCRAPSVVSLQRQSGDCRRGRLGVRALTTQDLNLRDASSHQVCIFWTAEPLVNELVEAVARARIQEW